MAEYSGFFDAHASVDAGGNVTYDRVYLAESFAKYFASFIGNGIFGGKSDELMVRQKESADMSIKVLSGQGFINGYFYENTDELSIAIDNADGVLNRIDLIVLRWDKYERAIRLAVEKGTPASSPSIPLLKRNNDYYELELARVYVKAGATRITQVDITDTRLDSDVCGFVVAVIDHFDTAAFSAQLNAWIDEFKIDSISEVNELLRQVNLILEVNDLSPIFSDIQALKSLSIESEENHGCYYRIVNGEVEWLNPPMEPGIEYKLTEKFENQSVYQMMVYVASLANNSFMNIRLNTSIVKVVSVTGIAHLESSYPTAHPFPVYAEGSTTPSAVIQSVGKDSIGYGISIRTSGDMRAYKANIIVKYTKA